MENDPNVSITTAEYFPRAEVVNKSDLKPITSRRTDLYHHEKVKLFQDIDSAINKSRALVDSLEKLPETGSDLIEIDFDEDGHRKLTEASYTAMPYKVSVRSTLPPKIRVNGQRPEITRKSLGGKEYHLERRQPDVTLSHDDRKPWKVAFHGGNLEYPKYLEKKHGERGISKCQWNDLRKLMVNLKIDISARTKWRKPRKIYGRRNESDGMMFRTNTGRNSRGSPK